MADQPRKNTVSMGAPAVDGARAADPRSRGFVHLHLHSEYSLLDGANRLDKLCARVKELGMDAVAVTDHGNLFGAAAFALAAKEAGIKPVLGIEAYVTPPGRNRRDRTFTGVSDGGYHLVLLAESDEGWANLLVLASEAYLTGFYFKPRIDRELLEKHSAGIIAINGHLGSEMGEHLLAYERSGEAKHWERALESAVWHKRVFGGEEGKGTGERGNEGLGRETVAAPSIPRSLDPFPLSPRFYIELQHHVREQNSINKHLIRLARELDLPMVCDNDSHFLNKEDHDAHDTLICISMGKSKNDQDRLRYPEEIYVKSAEEMRSLFEGEYGEVGREACDNTLRIAERCAGKVTLPIGQNNSPMVRVKIPAAGELPRHTDAEFAGDLTAWYTAYCARFEIVPFAVDPGASEDERQKILAEAKSECDTALRMLAEAGFAWRYGISGSPPLRGRGLGVGLPPAPVPGAHPDPDVTPPSASEAAHPPAPSLGEGAVKLARLERELRILADKNITAYFLIVWDFVNWGRQRAIPSTARGSGVGTMVGYVLGLSNACPVEYGLLFERFTDPDRSEYPDIDIDLCQDGRAAVINYVRQKYGHVAQIITFGTLKARAAVRDVCRVMDVPLVEADRLAKLIPEQLNITIDEALAQEPELRKAYEADERYRKVIDNARVFEGQTRHASVHAAGVIVATRPLSEIVPLYKQSGAPEHEVVTQWDGPTCEKMGLLKMDFLGLRTISVVERAKRLIRETLSEQEIWRAVGREAEVWARISPSQREGAGGRVCDDQLRSAHASVATSTDASAVQAGLRTNDPSRSVNPPPNPLPLGGRTGHPLDLDRLTYDDPRVFSLFQRADTTGVFQFESGGMRRLLVEMKPDRLEDLIAANALFRPGPMDLIPDYNRRKHGQAPVPSIHPIIDEFTRGTYGVMVYQEQVMQIVHGLGGITLRDAYSLIKNISKKRHDKIDKERPRFVEGAQRQGLTRDQAEDLFELILKFAGYGFNKSHSTGYAIVAYQTAYLKTYFPNQYMAAFLTYESGAQKVSDWIQYVEDCKRTRFASGKVGVEVRPPDINLSQAAFSVVYDEGEPRTAVNGHVRFGLGAIKGVGEKAIEVIIQERDFGSPSQREGAGGRVDDDGLLATHTHAATGSDVSADQAGEISNGPSRSENPPPGPLPLGGGTRHQFSSMFDFTERVLAAGAANSAASKAAGGSGGAVVNKTTLEALVRCGAMDCLHGRENRAAMVAAVEPALSAGSKAAADKAAGQSGLFAGEATKAESGGAAKDKESGVGSLPKVPPWSEAEILVHEKAALGFYVSSHPLERHKPWTSVFITADTESAKQVAQDGRVVMACLVQSVRTLIVKNGRSAGQKMAIVNFEDTLGSVESVLFADGFAQFGHMLTPDNAVFVLGRVDRSRTGGGGGGKGAGQKKPVGGDEDAPAAPAENSVQVVVDRVVPIEGVPLMPGRLWLLVDGQRLNGGSEAALRAIAELIQSESTGGEGAADRTTMFPLGIAVDSSVGRVRMEAAPQVRIVPTPELIGKIAAELGTNCIRVAGGVSLDAVNGKDGRGKWGRKAG